MLVTVGSPRQELMCAVCLTRLAHAEESKSATYRAKPQQPEPAGARVPTAEAPMLRAVRTVLRQYAECYARLTIFLENGFPKREGVGLSTSTSLLSLGSKPTCQRQCLKSKVLERRLSV